MQHPFSYLCFLLQVVPDSPAYLAGLRVHDVIVKCDGKPVQSFLEVCTFIMWDNNEYLEMFELDLRCKMQDYLTLKSMLFCRGSWIVLCKMTSYSQVVVKNVRLYSSIINCNQRIVENLFQPTYKSTCLRYAIHWYNRKHSSITKSLKLAIRRTC